jgi:hypothetical protein
MLSRGTRPSKKSFGGAGGDGMVQPRHDKRIGMLFLMACTIVGGAILSYVVWDAMTDDDMGIEHVPIALWSSAIALCSMAVIYAVVYSRDRRESDRSLQNRAARINMPIGEVGRDRFGQP